MKPVFIILLGLVFVFTALVLVINARSDMRPESSVFSTGSLPSPTPSGSLAGNHFSGLGENWQGKHFYASKNAGINNFKSKTTPTVIEQRYPFKTSVKQGLRNKNQNVLQLNYDVAGNPLWLRLIKDEIVEVRPGHFQGKIHLKVSFIVVTLGFFSLDSQ